MAGKVSILKTTKKFPLSIHPSGRYLVDYLERPFFINGDTPWSIEAQLTTAQVDTYLADRVAKGFNAILFEYMEHKFSSQTPAYENANGDNPFNPMTDFASPVTAYTQHVQYIVSAAKALGIVCFITPCYMSAYGGGTEGWHAEQTAESDADLQTFGAYLQTNIGSYGNVVWVMGGDDNNATRITKNWNIMTGIRSVRTDVIWTAHGVREGDPYTDWSALRDSYFINNVYGSTTTIGSLGATAYGRSGPYPFLMIEGTYENDTTVALCIVQAYQAILSGGCGHFFGNSPLWSFDWDGSGPASALSTYLDTDGANAMSYLASLFSSYAWYTLSPVTDTSLVTTSLGTGSSLICPALASDGSFAFIFTNGSNFTVDMSALNPSSVRARWYRCDAGTFSTDGASPLSNTGTHDFTVPAASQYVLVLEAA